MYHLEEGRDSNLVLSCQPLQVFQITCTTPGPYSYKGVSTVDVGDNLVSVVCSQFGDVHISPVTYFLQHFVHYFLFSHPWDNYFAILDKNIAKFFSLYSIQFRHKELKPVKT